MENNKLQHLIKHLNVGCIVLVEDDFSCLEDEAELISGLLYLNHKDVELLLEDLEFNANEKELVRNYISAFNKLQHEKKYTVKETRQVIELFLDIYKDTSQEILDLLLVANQVYALFEQHLKKNEIIKNVLLKYGVAEKPENYIELFKELEYQHSPVRIYKNAPPSKWTSINHDIDKLNMKPNDFILYIVDKNLGDGDTEAGTHFLDNQLKHPRNIISVMYTSKAKDININGLEDYFKIQIAKGSEELIEKITDGLALSAYVHLFRKMKEIYLQSIDLTFDMAVKRKENMLSLANLAHLEGITIFEVITNWIKLVEKKVTNESLFNESAEGVSNYSFIVGLTNFINENYLKVPDREIDQHFEEVLQELNTFEMFDYNVNRRHLPPAPGDVFMINNEYYILVGQECDTIVREDKASRNNGSADLLKCNFVPNILDNKIDTGVRNVIFNYFVSQDEPGALDVQLNQPMSCDFNIVDTVTFNTSGVGSIALEMNLDKDIEKLLPNAWIKYYNILQSKFKKIDDFNKILLAQGKKLSDLSSSEFDAFSYEEKYGFVEYPLKRICRLNGEFKDLLVKSYWNYRSRAGVNTIPLYEMEQIEFMQFEYGYKGKILSKLEKPYLAYIKREKKKKIKELELSVATGVIKKIYPNFSIDKDIITFVNKYEDNISKIEFEKIIDDQDRVLGVRMYLPIKVKEGDKIVKLLNKENIAVMDVISSRAKEFMSKRPKVLYYNDANELTIFNNNKINKDIMIDYSKGIVIPDFKITIEQTDDEIIIREKEDSEIELYLKEDAAMI